MNGFNRKIKKPQLGNTLNNDDKGNNFNIDNL